MNVGAKIKTSDIVAAYRKYGVSVERFFDNDFIELAPSAAGVSTFSGARAGDDSFYHELMARTGYDSSEKWEFRMASKYVSGKSVLDIGCGDGRFSRYCDDYTGIDSNKDAVQRGQRLGLNITTDRLTELEKKYDVVAMFQVLEHVLDPIAFLAEAGNLLIEDGLIIVCVPNMSGALGHCPNLLLNYPPHHLTWWSAETLTNALSRLGFDIVDIREEPLQSLHFWCAYLAMLAPFSAHFDSSMRLALLKVIAKFAGKFTKIFVDELSFIPGHTLMVVARRR